MTDIMVHLVVYRSRDGVNDWGPVHINECPEWLLDPGILARLAAGEECTNTADGAAVYRAIVVDDSNKEHPVPLGRPFGEPPVETVIAGAVRHIITAGSDVRH